MSEDNTVDLSTESQKAIDSGIAQMLAAPPMPGHPVTIDGRLITQLHGTEVNGKVHFLLDGRFGMTVPREMAVEFAWFVAEALAIGAGCPSINSDQKTSLFPKVFELDEVPQ